MHAKYEVSTCNISKVMANVKVGHKQTNKHTNTQTGQKQYAPHFSGRGHKNNAETCNPQMGPIWATSGQTLMRLPT